MHCTRCFGQPVAALALLLACGSQDLDESLVQDIPTHPVDNMLFFLEQSGNCLDMNSTEELHAEPCDRSGDRREQYWSWGWDLRMTANLIVSYEDGSCLTVRVAAGNESGDVFMAPCNKSSAMQLWIYDQKNRTLTLQSRPDLCLDHMLKPIPAKYGVYKCHGERRDVVFTDEKHNHMRFVLNRRGAFDLYKNGELSLRSIKHFENDGGYPFTHDFQYAGLSLDGKPSEGHLSVKREDEEVFEHLMHPVELVERSGFVVGTAVHHQQFDFVSPDNEHDTTPQLPHVPVLDQLPILLTQGWDCIDLHRDRMKLGLTSCYATLRQTFLLLKATHGFLVYSGATSPRDADGSCVVVERAASDAELLEGPCDIQDPLAQWLYVEHEKRIKLNVNREFCWQHVDGGYGIEDQWKLMDCIEDEPSQVVNVERHPRQYPKVRAAPSTHSVLFDAGTWALSHNSPSMWFLASAGVGLCWLSLLALRRRRRSVSDLELAAGDSAAAAE